MLTHQETPDDSGEGSTNEPLPGFLWRKLDERCSSKEEAKHVRHDVIADDHGYRNKEPGENDQGYEEMMDDS